MSCDAGTRLKTLRVDTETESRSIWRLAGGPARASAAARLARVAAGEGAAIALFVTILGGTSDAAFDPREATPRAADTVERRVLIMGTTFDVLVRASNRSRGLAAIETAVNEVAGLEDRLSTWRGDGPLFRLNQAAPGEEIALDPEIFAVVSEVFRWAERTNRAFDPTVLPLVLAWDLRGAGRVASTEEIAAALAAMGPGRFRLDADRRTIARLDPRAGIDEGAWGKGYALDRVAARLRASGVADAWLDLGGEVLGKGSEAGPWTVPVAHPRDRRKPAALLALPDGLALSTSGDSERRRQVAGRSIGHLLDPHTGRPAPDFGSVCVVAGSGFAADVLSTAFFVLGPREGLALSDRLRAEGIPNEALFLVDEGGALELPHSPGMSRFLLSTVPGVAAGAR
jgi:thiamine biosynthesis lipoprotein